MTIEIHSTGIAPKDSLLSNERLLLIAAKAYNLQSGIGIHRLSLYSFIQTHLANKSEENLQKTIETNIHWKRIGNGIYSITKDGQRELDKFSPHNKILPLTSLYSFWKKNEEDTISLTVNSITGRYDNLTVNGIKKTQMKLLN